MSDNPDESLAALAALSTVAITTKTATIDKPEKISHKVKQFPIFSTGLLLCYIQGEAPGIFMQATIQDYESALEKPHAELKNFLKPLWLILHNNKNIKFRPINSTRLTPIQRAAFDEILFTFRKGTTLESFLKTYSAFLDFMAHSGFPIRKDKVFLDLETFALYIANYRDQCKQAAQAELFSTVTADDIKNLVF